jgi:mitotic spindle assembly checkpoint protein MAD2B
VREYVAEVTAAMGKEMMGERLRRVTIVIKRVEDGLPVERFIVDLGYLGLAMEGNRKNIG